MQTTASTVILEPEFYYTNRTITMNLHRPNLITSEVTLITYLN